MFARPPLLGPACGDILRSPAVWCPCVPRRAHAVVLFRLELASHLAQLIYGARSYRRGLGRRLFRQRRRHSWPAIPRCMPPLRVDPLMGIGLPLLLLLLALMQGRLRLPGIPRCPWRMPHRRRGAARRPMRLRPGVPVAGGPLQRVWRIPGCLNRLQGGRARLARTLRRERGRLVPATRREGGRLRSVRLLVHAFLVLPVAVGSRWVLHVPVDGMDGPRGLQLHRLRHPVQRDRLRRACCAVRVPVARRGRMLQLPVLRQRLR